jgi:hypothetical protein
MKKIQNILDLIVKFEPPFIPNGTMEGCTPEEYAAGRERVIIRQFMRHVARMLIKENIELIRKEADNVRGRK